ncbi:MAG: leucine-rich repeat domain-containing protein, partial [Anaerolineales bacterium]|nr:leucine-rich repeat domain-containing protein [Anaerolineales bacterium]
MKRLHNSLFLILFIITASCFGYSFKPPTKTGAAGAPDNGETCISCHGSSGNGSLVVSNLPNQYKSGEKYTLSIKLSQSGRQRWGFILTALDQNGNQAGTFESNDANTQVFSASGRQYIGHTSSGTAAKQANSNTWLMDWIAPVVDTGKISFYASGNAANNNGKNTGDNGYKTEITIEAEVEAGVNIPDANLRAALEKALGKNEGDAITKEELARLTRWDALESWITDLTGLEHCTGLTTLNLYRNEIIDISALANLTNLTHLELHGNQLSDVSPLTNLTKLEKLDLS